MLVTFNCGVGMVIFVAAEDEAHTLGLLHELGENAFTIGEIDDGEGKPNVHYF
jgi:phosphoribosylformylglycinamidine cyclo-ligase